MSFQQSITQLKQHQLAPVYLLYGTETYLMDWFEETLITAVLGAKTTLDDFNFARIDMDDATLDDVIVEANTVSFFTAQRLIWVKNAAFLGTERAKRKENEQILLDYLENPNPDVVICFQAPYEKLDNRKKVVKAFKKQAEIVEAKPLNEREVTDYVKQYIFNEGKTIDRQTLTLLLERTNYELTRTMEEVNKLILFVSEAQNITSAAVKLVVAPSLDDNIFHLSDYVMQQAVKPAIQLYRTLIAEKQQPIAILALLSANFRLYTQVALLRQVGYGQGEIAKAINAHPFRVKMAMKQINRYSTTRLIQGYQQLIELEDQMKTGQIDQNLGLEWFILKFAEERAQAH
ncbi:MAG: DNA polymerase III subunit delta [Aerococcus sp.]|nr:DNA polymerase III subunit delta [Aerococcus sp.]